MMESTFRLLEVLSWTVKRRFILNEGLHPVGRSVELPICLFHPTVSRRHAEVKVFKNHITVRDVGSRSGTFIGGRQIQTAPLRSGQWVEFGSARLLLTTDHDEPNFNFEPELETHDPRFSKDRLLELPPDLKAQFSPRQLEVLQWACRGLAKKQIAAKLECSMETVKSHLLAIRSICRVGSVGELQYYIFRRVVQALTSDMDNSPNQQPTIRVIA